MSDQMQQPETLRVPELQNYSDGAWTSVADSMETRNPYTGEVIGSVPLSSAADVQAVARAARGAAAEWGRVSPMARARAVMAMRELLRAHREELAALVTLDMGKTYPDALGEVDRGLESVEMACAIPELLKGEALAGVARAIDVAMLRQPLGVTAAITPFNFPAMIPLWFLPFAVACGNSFILKPSEQDPLAPQRIVELLHEAEIFPPGVVNLVHGAKAAVNALLDDPCIDAISFVGSAATARYVYRRAAEQGKRVQALGGAKNALVVMPDAEPELMVRGVLSSAFGAAGQRCLAGSVLLLVGSPQEQQASLERIVEASGALITGDGADPRTAVCPVVSVEARERLERSIDEAERRGARLLLDGRGDGGRGGAELAPTIVDGVEPSDEVVTEELFGPVLAVMRASTLEEAVTTINTGRYGNASVIFTTSGHAGRTFCQDVEAGMVGINVGVAAPVAWFPFSGWKESFNGDLHANGRDAVEFFTRKKVVTTRWS